MHLKDDRLSRTSNTRIHRRSIGFRSRMDSSTLKGDLTSGLCEICEEAFDIGESLCMSRATGHIEEAGTGIFNFAVEIENFVGKVGCFIWTRQRVVGVTHFVGLRKE